MQINIINFIIHKVFTVFLLQINSLYIRSDVIQRESYKSKAVGKLFFFSALLLCIFDYNHETFRASLVAQRVKHLPAMQETWV